MAKYKEGDILFTRGTAVVLIEILVVSDIWYHLNIMNDGDFEISSYHIKKFDNDIITRLATEVEILLYA